jgi:hypothetical protein
MISMKFKVNSITKSIEIWDHQPKKNFGEFSLRFEVEPTNGVIKLGKDEIICSKSEFEENDDYIVEGLIRINSYLHIYNKKNISPDIAEEINDSIGIVTYSGEFLSFFIYLDDEYFQKLMVEVKSSNNIFLFIIPGQFDEHVNRVVTSDEGLHGIEYRWIDPKLNKTLKIEHFSLNIEL